MGLFFYAHFVGRFLWAGNNHRKKRGIFIEEPHGMIIFVRLKLSTMLKKKYLFVLALTLISSLLLTFSVNAQNTRSTEKEVITFRTPLDVFNYLQSRSFKSSDGVTLDIRPDGIKANSRPITAAVQVTYIQAQRAILNATSPYTGHKYTFLVYVDKNCVICHDDNTMYFGRKKE